VGFEILRNGAYKHPFYEVPTSQTMRENININLRDIQRKYNVVNSVHVHRSSLRAT